MIDKFLKSFVGEERIAQLKFERSFFTEQRENRPVLFVHQMGKVGSTSIVKSLKNNGKRVPWRIYQTHFLSTEGMEFIENIEAEAYGGWSRIPRKSKRFLMYSRAISKHLSAGDFSTRPCKVISLVRDPVSTNLSGFFHNHHWWPDDLSERCRSGAPGWEEELLEYFMRSYPHNVPADWFDLEMKPVFGVDVFAGDFDNQAGYGYYESQTFPLLVLRLENLGESLTGVISNFLDLDDFTLHRSNSGQDKWYAELYASFKSAVSFPAAYLNQMYSSAFVRHFYTPAEIAAFRKRWEEPESIGIVAAETE